MPAEPAVTLRETIIGDVVLTLPTVTVFTVPTAGGVSVVTCVSVVGV
jgi:hypothetical protein